MSSSWAAVILGNVKIRKVETGTGISALSSDTFSKGVTTYYNIAGQQVGAQTKGLVIEKIQLANGKTVTRKMVK